VPSWSSQQHPRGLKTGVITRSACADCKDCGETMGALVAYNSVSRQKAPHRESLPLCDASHNRYHGVLAPSAAFRPLIIPELDSSAIPAHANCPARQQYSAANNKKHSGCRPRNYSWAELMNRIFSVDVLECSRCGGRMRILCAIHPPDAIRKILDCLGIPSRPAPVAPASGADDPWIC